ncbi:MAG: hypothetical protein WCS45_06235 [Clostridia bacterium]
MKPREECGVFGIIVKEKIDCGRDVYAGLISQQHRGQESAGICAFKDGEIVAHKGLGLVSSVFDPESMTKFEDIDIAIGHVRYSTDGNNGLINAQPIVTNHRKISSPWLITED